MIKRREFFGAAAALVPGACTTTQNPGAPTTSYTAVDDDYSKYYSLFNIGNTFKYDSSTFNIDLVVVPNSPQVAGVLGNRQNLSSALATLYAGEWADNALPIFHALKTGKIPALSGQTTATIIFNLVQEHMPRRLVYLNQMRSVGWADVRPSGISGHSEVTIPVMSGGLAELALPRKMMLRQVRNKRGQESSVVPVVRLGMRALQLPRITDGMFKDWPNTLISKPSGTPGISHAAMRARLTVGGRVKHDGVLFPFVVDTGVT